MPTDTQDERSASCHDWRKGYRLLAQGMATGWCVA